MREAFSAPSAIAFSFIQTMSGSTVFQSATVAKPQSVLAMTRSRPTTSAKRQSRSATRSG